MPSNWRPLTNLLPISVTPSNQFNAQQNASSISFQGSLETPATFINEYDKDMLVSALKEQIRFYGLQHMYSTQIATELYVAY